MNDLAMQQSRFVMASLKAKAKNAEFDLAH